MKQLITILLLLAISGQVAGIFYSKSIEIKLVQELDDKKEKESKEDKKEEKQFSSNSFSFQSKVSDKESFISIPVIILTSPVIGGLTPPPDTTPRV